MTLTPTQQDTLERAAWTFLQSFLSVLVVGGQLLQVDRALFQTALLAGVAALLSVVKQLAKSYLTSPPDA